MGQGDGLDMAAPFPGHGPEPVQGPGLPSEQPFVPAGIGVQPQGDVQGSRHVHQKPQGPPGLLALELDAVQHDVLARKGRGGQGCAKGCKPILLIQIPALQIPFCLPVEPGKIPELIPQQIPFRQPLGRLGQLFWADLAALEPGKQLGAGLGKAGGVLHPAKGIQGLLHFLQGLAHRHALALGAQKYPAVALLFQGLSGQGGKGIDRRPCNALFRQLALGLIGELLRHDTPHRRPSLQQGPDPAAQIPAFS